MSTDRLLPSASNAATQAKYGGFEGSVVEGAEHVADLGRAETAADEDRSAVKNGELQELLRLGVVRLAGKVDDNGAVRAERERCLEDSRFHLLGYLVEIGASTSSSNLGGMPKTSSNVLRPRCVVMRS